MTGPVGTAKSVSALNTEISSNIVDNTSGLISPSILRQTLLDTVASFSNSPLDMGAFGLVADAQFNQATNYITATSDGSATLTTSNTNGVKVGANIANISWHSFAAAAVGSAGVIPVGTTVLSFVANTSITLSNPVVAASNISLIWWTETLTGTDNTAAMQACLDYAMQNGISDIRIPPGRYLISDTLQAGWGDSFYELHILGTDRFSYQGAYPGVVIYSTKTDRPVLSFQGMRAASLKGVTFIGRTQQFTDYAQGFSNLLSSDPLDWIDPRFVPSGNNPGGIQQHAPYAGVTVDAFCGTKPVSGGAYPDRTYPAWVIANGYSVQYNSVHQSSDILIQDCSFQGFGVNTVSGLNTDSQGDFFKQSRCFMSSCVYGTSICNNQSRNIEFENITAARYHTLFSGTNLGQQDGEVVGPLNNISGGDAYQFFDFQNLSISGNLLISNIYCENQIRIGNFVGGTSFPGSILLRGGLINLQNTNGQIPDSYITSGQFGSIYMKGVQVNGHLRIANFIKGGGTLTIEGGGLLGAQKTPATAAQQQAINYCGGFLMGDIRFNASNNRNYRVRNCLGSYYATVSGTITSYTHDAQVSYRSSAGALTRAPMTQGATEYTDQIKRQWKITVPNENTFNFASFTNSGPTYANDQMTFGYLQAFQEHADFMYHLAVGDILFVLNTWTIFVVTAVGVLAGGAYPITTIQQNNLQIDGTNAFVKNFNSDTTLAGSIVIIKTGAVIPLTLNYATFSSGSGNLTAVTTGAASSMANNIVNGDVFFGLSQSVAAGMPYQKWPVASGSIVSAVNDGAGTVTLSKNALASGTFPLFPYELR